MDDCIFCKIANKEIPSKIVYEDDKVVAFNDIDPKAPVHVLIIPKEHIPSPNHINSGNSTVSAHIASIIPKLAKQFDIYDSGYRVVVNCGKDGGQTVGHLHYHLLGGRNLDWPPG
ncbi:MAG: histidine triad nucleotide-binding protein [Xylanivirga thermophila]|jgi:histidine triad (HIT) family protein|uniref:histidine triad nucleotide-binding protein n=1 Tax=Xylanivirga thermophila TaxID=2496273 RepID=UPI00101C64F7|nr:histidine triad nucleotide-binding protein [Xylanivirga thermophila]